MSLLADLLKMIDDAIDAAEPDADLQVVVTTVARHDLGSEDGMLAASAVALRDELLEFDLEDEDDEEEDDEDDCGGGDDPVPQSFVDTLVERMTEEVREAGALGERVVQLTQQLRDKNALCSDLERRLADAEKRAAAAT